MSLLQGGDSIGDQIFHQRERRLRSSPTDWGIRIFVCDSDGSNCAQLTSLHGVAGTARMSPDGLHIAFEFRRQEHEEIYVVEVPGVLTM